MVFFAMAALCVGSFAAYHLVMVGRGMTTYESIKAEECTCKRGQARPSSLVIRNLAHGSGLMRNMQEVFWPGSLSESSIGKKGS